MTEIFTSKIYNLISSNREGQYWDFKKTYHKNKANLLHDILCLANSIHKGRKYLIFGVADPSERCQIFGIDNDENRRSQAEIIDFLRSKKFAGDIRPEIELDTMEMNNYNIDVLIIFDRPNKPYFLIEDYIDGDKKVKSNHIYTRTLDTNTPIDQSADLRVIEQMWRERFYLDILPSEKIVELLNNPDEWDGNIEPNHSSHNRNFPEYQIEFGNTRKFLNVLSYFYPNEKSYIGEARFIYFSTILFTLPYILCDEMRITIAYPKISTLILNNKEIIYMYYILGDRNGAFLKFLRNGQIDFKSRGGNSSFVLFKDEDERRAFEDFLVTNPDNYENLEDSDLGRSILSLIQQTQNKFRINPIDMIKVKQIHKYWRTRVVGIINDD